jgi:UDP-N-acetylmuramoyl-L-alanyl-D-glutamate--2,6-diaminopimelate ligase
VVNVDDSFGCQLSEDVEPKSLIRYSVDSDDGPTAEVKLLASEVTANGQNIHASTPLGEITAVTALLGDFNVENTLACIATLLALGLDYNQIELAVKDLKPIPGRMEKFAGERGSAAAVVDFAHTRFRAYRAGFAGLPWCESATYRGAAVVRVRLRW